MDVKEFNKGIIEEFRANGGVVGGPFEGANLLLLHSTGARSGAARINPLAYFRDGDAMLIVASYAGASSHPPWYHNLLAHPDAKVEVGADTFDVKAEVVAEPDRTRLYDGIAAQAATFAEYQQKTSRVIPIIRLTKVD